MKKNTVTTRARSPYTHTGLVCRHGVGPLQRLLIRMKKGKDSWIDARGNHWDARTGLKRGQRGKEDSTVWTLVLDSVSVIRIARDMPAALRALYRK